VAELQEAPLLDVRILVGVEDRVDARARRVDRIGEVHPLETAVLQHLSGRLRAADRVAEGAGLRRAEGLVRVAVVGEGPVDADRVGHDLAQHALGDADLRALDVEGSLRIQEVVHVRRQPEGVGELAVHRVGGVQDHEDVRVGARVGLQELPVVRPGRSGDQKRQKPGDAGLMPVREVLDAAGTGSVAHSSS
jgi:hypothetical protein